MNLRVNIYVSKLQQRIEFQIKLSTMEFKYKSLKGSLKMSKGRHEAKRTNFRFLIPKSKAKKIKLQIED
jgi:hypothetical protein